MKYFCVEPEVAGGIGENIVMDRSVHPPVVTRLHYEFYGWGGDVLLTTFPVFIVTGEAAEEFRRQGLTGFTIDSVECTRSAEFDELYPGVELPQFVWLRIEEGEGRQDFETTLGGRLVVSERAIEVLKRMGIANAVVTVSEG